nr:hypothetical protein [Staphylococcus agnetis]
MKQNENITSEKGTVSDKKDYRNDEKKQQWAEYQEFQNQQQKKQ